MSETLKLEVMIAEPGEQARADLQRLLEQVAEDLKEGATIGAVEWHETEKMVGTYIVVRGEDEDYYPRCQKCDRGVQNMEQLRYGHCIDCLAQPGVLEQASGARPMDHDPDCDCVPCNPERKEGMGDEPPRSS